MHITMAKLSQQISSVSGRATRTERKISVQEEKPTQTLLPKGSLGKTDVQRRLAEEKQKEKQIDLDRAEAYKILRLKFPHGENMPLSTRQQFNRGWNIKREQIGAKIRILNQLNSTMKSNSYLAETKLSGYLTNASNQAFSDFERSERGRDRRRKENEKLEVQELSPQLSQENIKALEKDINLRGITPEGTALLKDAGIVRKSSFYQRAGETTLQFQNRKALVEKQQGEQQARESINKEIAEGEKSRVDIEAVRVDTSSLGFWQKAGYTFRKTTPKMLGVNYQNLIGIGGFGYGREEGEEAVTKVVSYATPKVVSGIDKIVQSTIQLGVPVFTAGPGSKTIFTVKEGKQTIKEDLGLIGKKEEIYASDLEKRGLTQTYQPKFEEEYKTEFLKKYGEEIITGNILQDQAEIDFAKSDEAKEVGRRYQEVIDIERGKKITTGSFKLYGLGLVDMGLKLIPETAGGLALETGAIASAVYFGGKIPPSVINTAYGFGTVWGTATALDPTISPEKRVGGIVLAGTSATMLGISGIKYLRQPTIKTVKIKPPKISVKADNIIAKEGKIYRITGGGDKKLLEQVTFGNQKIQQIGIGGRRTIVSTRWRDILAKGYRNLGVSEKSINTGFSAPVYRGVPTAQRGTTYSLQSIRGTYTYTTPSGYQKALDLLTKRMKLSETTARGVLKYTAPKVIDVTLEKGILNIVGDKAIGNFGYRIDQPIIEVDKVLGIKTRGAKSFLKDYKIYRYKDEGGNIVTAIKEQVGGKVTYSLERSLVKVGDINNAFNKIALRIGGNKNYFEISKKIPYEYQDITSKYVRQQRIPFKNEYDIGKAKTSIIKRSPKQEVIDLNLDKYNQFSFPKRTGTFGGSAEEEIKRILSRQSYQLVDPVPNRLYANLPTNVRNYQMFEKPLQIKPFSFQESSNLVQQREFKRLFPAQLDPALKVGFSPVVNLKDNIQSMIKFNTALPKVSLDLGKELILGLAIKQSMKQELNLGLELSLGLGLKQLLKNDLKQKIETKQTLKQSQKLSPALKLSQILNVGITPTTPIYREPVIPQFKIPTFPIILPTFWLPTEKSNIKNKIKSMNFKKELAFLPDFTARSLGLGAETLTQKQARKKIKQLQTGFEIRRGVKLLKGIPE